MRREGGPGTLLSSVELIVAKGQGHNFREGFFHCQEGAATAASLAIDDRVTVQTVNYAELRKRLLEAKQVLP